MTTAAAQQQKQRRPIVRLLLLGLAALCAYGNIYIHRHYVATSRGVSSSSIQGRTLDDFILASLTTSKRAVREPEGLLRPGKNPIQAPATLLSTTRESQQQATTIVAASPVASFQQTQTHPRQDNSQNQKSMPDEEQSLNTYFFPRHGCQVNTIGKHRIHCHFQNLRIDRTKISAGHLGGEPLETVMGSAEETEFLSYQPGAFVLQSPLDPVYPLVQQHPENNFWYMNDVHNAVRYETNNNTWKCDQVWTGLTLFTTRYEYVNLYHTMTDWWNAFYSLPTINRLTNDNTNSNTTNGEKSMKKVNVVFLDAHPQGNLDPVWLALFGGKVSFVRHLPFENTCFEEARFIPAGYTSPVYPRISHNAMLSDWDHAGAFVEHVLNAYNLNHVHRIPGHVVVIERVKYISHPRSKPENTERLLGNMEELALNLPSLFPNTNVTVQVVTLVNDTMRDQIAAIRQADILLANHGAGLTHLLFLDAGAHVVELNCKHQFFPELAKWRRDIHHHCQWHESQQGRISASYWEHNVVSVMKQAVL
jgi:hypothetical protein